MSTDTPPIHESNRTPTPTVEDTSDATLRELATEYNRVNLGSGSDYRGGWLNIDVDSGNNPDAVYDLTQTPWPIPENSMDEVVMLNVLEHLDDHLTILRELHRITIPGGRITVAGPHWNSPGTWIDPTHVRPFDHRMFTHDLVEHLFTVDDISCTRVRWGRLVPEQMAITLADHISHGVAEIEVSLNNRCTNAAGGDER